MEVYLRIGLWVLGGILVLSILFQSWFRKKASQPVSLVNDSFNANEVLGLSPKQVVVQEPVHTEPVPEPELDRQLQINFEQLSPPLPKKKPVNNDDILILRVVAKKGCIFASYDLIQAITATGMQFGDMNIFHFYTTMGSQRKPLFSLASATEPGDFDLDRMGDFKCSGLTLFTRLNDVPDPQRAFDLMLKAAEQLADDLGGELRANPPVLWNDEIRMKYQHRILQFRTSVYT